MSITPGKVNTEPHSFMKVIKATPTASSIHELAFANSAQPSIITIAGNGKIIIANNAACKLLGYSQKELISKNRSAIFDINEDSFKKMLKERTDEGQSIVLGTAIKKSGELIPCEITSAVFMDDDAIEKAITTIADMSQSILKQKGLDAKKEKVVADNIILAKSDQKKIDVKKEKIVADNILLAQEKSDAKLADNSEWIKYIAKTSYDVMWDWDIISGEVYVGDSIEEIFGYKVQNNRLNIKDLANSFLTGENITVEENLRKALSSGSKSWRDSYTIKRFDGSVAAVNSRGNIVRDENGKAVRLIGATQDVSRLKELEKELDKHIATEVEGTDILHLVGGLSNDGIWDWHILTNEFFLGEGFEELFGYRFNHSDHNSFDWAKHLHPDDKETVQKGIQDALASTSTRWEDTYRFVRADGSVANVFGRASIIRNADGKAYRMIGAMHDLSRQKELEEKLEEEIATRGKLLSGFKENFKLIFNSSSDSLFDADLLTNEVTISDGYEKEFGYKITGNAITTTEWLNHIHPDDKEAILQDYRRMLDSELMEWKYSYRFVRADHSVANVVSSAIILRNTEHTAYRMIGSIQDVSKQTILEDKLEKEIQLKEKQVAKATQEARQTERSDIGKELHDNVNQLLAVSKLYIDMAKKGGVSSDMYLSRSSEYTLTAIEEIRKITKGLTTDTIKELGLCEAIDNIVRDTMEVNPVKIAVLLESFKEDSVNDKFKLNLFRIVQEQINNIIKHAKATEVRLSVVQTKNSIVLSIYDNGVGFDTGKKQKGIGVANIKSRAAKYDGTADFISQPGQGCVLTVTLPLADIPLPAFSALK
ncbi:MAG: PAS domain-containing protein [Ferruginibacter sp.]|nr:PAS domain-containing protein [Chitinophagaceae bacterium]